MKTPVYSHLESGLVSPPVSCPTVDEDREKRQATGQATVGPESLAEQAKGPDSKITSDVGGITLSITPSIHRHFPATSLSDVGLDLSGVGQTDSTCHGLVCMIYVRCWSDRLNVPRVSLHDLCQVLVRQTQHATG